MDVSHRSSRRHSWTGEAGGILLLLAALLALLALLSYHGTDPSFFRTGAPPQRNWIGGLGANVAELLLQLFGAAAFLVPLALAYLGLSRFRSREGDLLGRTIGLGIVLLSLSALLDLLYARIAYGGETFAAGGNVMGRGIARALTVVLGATGAFLVAAAGLLAGIVAATRFSFSRAGALFARRATRWGAALALRVRNLREERRRSAARRGVEKKHAKRAAERPGIEEPAPAIAPAVRAPLMLGEREGAPGLARPEPRAPAQARQPAHGPAPAAQARQPSLPLAPTGAGFALPPLELLNEPRPQQGEEQRALFARAQQLTEKFREFAVEGQVVAIHPGPVVTTFEFKPEAGVKYSKITALVDDLCLALKAESVRIDRMPGRSTVGIEVPNLHQETIYPRELLGSDRFRNTRSKLALALGKEISGEVFVADLDRMPHLLIAGATGAGKSVGLNGMIASILYKATPSDVRFILIDTKLIELGLWADIPHLLVPVVTDPKAASVGLKWAVREMEVRYRKLASVGVRNIEQFNTLLEAEPGRTMTDERTNETVPLSKLPYIVIVIDELADLMMVSSADVEESVMRLAQMARAVGIHLILATQRPSVDIITGTVKANFPARIAFRVSQRVDSRTIIDQQGAEHLLGRGDMLFLPPSSVRLLRLHGGYITETELNRIVAFLKKQGKPVYDESVLKEPEEEGAGFDFSGDRDTMFLEAVRLVLQEGMCSITLLQRRLRLGYARAARIVDTMEQDGIIGPADGSKPREVLVGPEILETLGAPR